MISRPKMSGFIKSLQNPETEEQLVAAFKSLDGDRSGELTFEEWKALGA
jgi:Ca2+-binding EF-hand superfamily protein